MKELGKVTQLIVSLEQGQRITPDEWEQSTSLPYSSLGLVEVDKVLCWPQGLDLISQQGIAQSLLVEGHSFKLHVHKCIGSTNSLLVEEAQSKNINDQVHIAEFQYQGRGRRGRQWVSPYARNLAVSLGRASGRDLDDLSGLSLVAGLALAEALESAGVQNLSLKWPNDIWVEHKKLAGILVELVKSESGVQVIIGFGINVDLTADEILSIDQPVTDVRRCGSLASRNTLVALCLNSLTQYLDLFENKRFNPFVSAFNMLHTLHGQQCNLIAAGDAPDRSVKVLGVSETGALIVATNVGVEHVHGGEVSIRLAESKNN
mgnify:FL=1